MRIPTQLIPWRGSVLLAVLLAALLAACSAAELPPASPDPSGEVAALRQQVASQAAQIAALETQAASNQPAASQAAQISLLQTQVTGLIPPATAIPQPTPTMIPAVTGLVLDANTKGSPSAKVTITEYVDYF